MAWETFEILEKMGERPGQRHSWLSAGCWVLDICTRKLSVTNITDLKLSTSKTPIIYWLIKEYQEVFKTQDSFIKRFLLLLRSEL